MTLVKLQNDSGLNDVLFNKLTYIHAYCSTVIVCDLSDRKIQKRKTKLIFFHNANHGLYISLKSMNEISNKLAKSV